jgi:hypothetical protein
MQANDAVGLPSSFFSLKSKKKKKSKKKNIICNARRFQKVSQASPILLVRGAQDDRGALMD